MTSNIDTFRQPYTGGALNSKNIDSEYGGHACR